MNDDEIKTWIYDALNGKSYKHYDKLDWTNPYMSTRTNNNYEEKKNMKKCEVCLPDGNGKAQIGENCLFICPTHTGFILFTNPTGSDVEMHCYESFEG